MEKLTIVRALPRISRRLEHWKEFMAIFLQRVESTASSEYPTLGSIYRGRKPVPPKLTEMAAVNPLKDYTGGKKHSGKVR